MDPPGPLLIGVAVAQERPVLHIIPRDDDSRCLLPSTKNDSTGNLDAIF